MVEIHTEKVGSVTVAHLNGALTSDQGDGFAERVLEMVFDDDAPFVLELADLETIDSCGLGALITIATRTRMRGNDVALAAPNAFVNGVLGITQLDKFFNVHESIDAACAALEGN